ncbi:hypothetical protein HCN44_000795 [Aphidius gifuensis]|uniref:TIL domain-containing protein n=1 Tax=Aphidius gifuensis TaxID=684658 RepID=A0A834XPI5_APHGI|nr:hypothetical protein HCN44_000795 [Aphidius gifuensis]
MLFIQFTGINAQDEPQCESNEEYSRCSKNCESICPGTPKPCSFICVPGCICIPGYSRTDKKGINAQGDILCEDENEVPTECGKACELICPGKPRPCPKICVSGCVCIEGYARTDKNGINAQGGIRCNENEVWSQCSKNCESICPGTPKACILSCKAGCYCKDGWIRQKDGLLCVEQCKSGSLVDLIKAIPKNLHSYLGQWFVSNN